MNLKIEFQIKKYLSTFYICFAEPDNPGEKKLKIIPTEFPGKQTRIYLLNIK